MVMVAGKKANLAFLFIDESGEDKKLITDALKSANIDAESSERRIKELLKRSRAEAKLKEGAKFKENYVNLLTAIHERGSLFFENIEMKNLPGELQVAFRKFNDSLETGNEELITEKEKLLVLEFLKKNSRRRQNPESGRKG